MRHDLRFFFAPDGVGTAGISTIPILIPSPTEFRGAIKKSNDLSAIVAVGDLLIVASDEIKDPSLVQVLKADGNGYKKFADVTIAIAGEDEVDFEGLAADGNTVYVTGSHARARKIEGGVIGEPKRKKSREQFFRFQLNTDGTAGPVEGPKSLTDVIFNHPVLKDFVGVASKENGIDIEGLAFRDGKLFFGFRSPVLRYGFVPVIACEWDDPAASAETRYLQLGGRGIRDLQSVAGGLLVLAGPPGDGDGTYRIYFWDGTDRLNGGSDSGLRMLGEFPPLGDGHPEAITVTRIEGNTVEVLLLCDGLPNGGPTRWKLELPSPV